VRSRGGSIVAEWIRGEVTMALALTVKTDEPAARPSAAVPDDPFLSLVVPRAHAEPGRPVLGLPERGVWRDATYADVLSGARALSSRLLAMGLEPGDRVALLSESRPEWAMALLGVWRSGGILVPLDVKATAVELAAVLEDCRPVTLVVSEAQSGLAREAAAGAATRLESLEGGVRPRWDRCDDASAPERSVHETAFLIYTSGTTGRPKGVEITLGNLVFEVQSLLQVNPFHPDDVLVSILPLHHLLELVCGLLVPLHVGARVCYSPSLFPQDVVALMREQRATVMLAVPLFLKLMKAAIEREVRARGRAARLGFRAALAVARVLPMSSRRRVFAAVHAQLGGRLRAFICGGAPLDREVADFFERLGVQVYEGYGLTETSPVVAVNGPGARRPGTVGRPLPGVRVRIEAGEVLTAGPHVMRGYYRRPEVTAEVFDGEWLRTGDLGELDADGFLRITGRLKNLIVLPGGRKVQPEEVEAVLARSALVREVCVAGTASRGGLSEGDEEVCAVVVPSETLADRFAGRADALAEEIRKDLGRIAAVLSPYKRPTRLVVRAELLPMTSTRKIRRPQVRSWLAAQGVPAR
jgi:long-chain acyl-CoA synthetase